MYLMGDQFYNRHFDEIESNDMRSGNCWNGNKTMHERSKCKKNEKKQQQLNATYKSRNNDAAAATRVQRSTKIVILNWRCNAVKDLCWVHACVFVSVFGLWQMHMKFSLWLCVTKIGVCEWKTKMHQQPNCTIISKWRHYMVYSLYALRFACCLFVVLFILAKSVCSHHIAIWHFFFLRAAVQLFTHFSQRVVILNMCFFTR